MPGDLPSSDAGQDGPRRQFAWGAFVRAPELEEVPMPIVGGLDIHRKQITFDYLDTVTGQVQRGQISPADREHLRAWLARFAGCEDAAFAVEGCTGWRLCRRGAGRGRGNGACRRSANSLAGRSRNSAPGPGVDGAVASFLPSMSEGSLVVPVTWPSDAAQWAGQAGPARFSCRQGPQWSPGSRPGPRRGPSPQAMRSSLGAGGAVPYPLRGASPGRRRAAHRE